MSRIKRTEYVRRDGVVLPSKKTILEKVEEDAYLVKGYGWAEKTGEWYPTRGTCYFDGVERKITGRVVICDDVDRRFQLCVGYEGFVKMGDNELDTDTEAETEYLESILSESDDNE